MNLLWMLFIFLGHQNVIFRASLVVQWLRIHLPMQGTQVPSSVGGIPHSESKTPKLQVCSRVLCPKCGIDTVGSN